jgi:hypothetical protein
LCDTAVTASTALQHEVMRFWETVSHTALRDAQSLTAQHIQDLSYAWALRKLQDAPLFQVRVICCMVLQGATA